MIKKRHRAGVAIVALFSTANPTSKARGGWLDNLRTLSSLDFGKANDGISLTTQVAPKALGKTFEEQVENLVTILDGYFESGGQHVNLRRH